MIRISVIIPTYNRRHVLERTLPGVLAQDFPPQDYEVIVVMDGSTDGTAEMLRDLKPKCSLRVLESQHRGAGAARNVGIRAAVGELVLFLDDDLITTPGLLGSIAQHILEPIHVWYRAACISRPTVRKRSFALLSSVLEMPTIAASGPTWICAFLREHPPSSRSPIS